MTVHTHTFHVSNFKGDFMDAHEIGIKEALTFFPFCCDHSDAALDSGALQVKVTSNKSKTMDNHNLAIEITYDDEVDLNDHNHDDDPWNSYEASSFLPAEPGVPPF